ncbi:MAG: amidohydrolase family protein [Ktedonobacterales bacterium]|nr:amidohydrolase family protein [Ktedonobacterales bacterium]
MLTLYHARFVFPVATAPIRDGAVAIEDERILAVGADATLAQRYPSARRIDTGESALLPAAVNAHTHLVLTRMAGVVPEELPFAAWIRALTQARRAADPADDVRAVAEGVARLRAAGTAAVGDITTNPASIGPLVESGLRGIVYYELLNRDPAQALETLRRGQEQIARWREMYPGARLRFGLSPHAPYTVSAPLLRLVSEWCAGEGVPLCIHAAESPAETRWLRDHTGPLADDLYRPLGLPLDLEPAPGCSPIAYLERLGVLRGRPLLAHGVHVDGDDLAYLAHAGTPVAHCPRSNARLHCGRMPYAAYRQAGVPLALGTDSLASSPTLSLWDEVADAHARHTAAGEAPSPAELLRLATLGGAEALGLADEVGTIAPGKWAELVRVGLGGLDARERESAEAVLAALCAGRLAAQRMRT